MTEDHVTGHDGPAYPSATDGEAAPEFTPSASFTVDDDGPGIAASKRAEAVKRGKRLDETKPGSGLGLSIVTETAGMYSGNLVLGDAPLGGLRVQLRLPAVA